VNIAAGPDGNLWVTEYFGNNVAKVTTSGAITEYPVPTTPGTNGPGMWGITAGPHRSLWFTEFFANKVASIEAGPPRHKRTRDDPASAEGT
jgi:virginiamycin B lyase